jgi:hypothetical protein
MAPRAPRSRAKLAGRLPACGGGSELLAWAFVEEVVPWMVPRQKRQWLTGRRDLEEDES